MNFFRLLFFCVFNFYYSNHFHLASFDRTSRKSFADKTLGRVKSEEVFVSVTFWQKFVFYSFLAANAFTLSWCERRGEAQRDSSFQYNFAISLDEATTFFHPQTSSQHKFWMNAHCLLLKARLFSLQSALWALSIFVLHSNINFARFFPQRKVF